MASVALALKSLRIVDVLGFDFLDAPDQKQLACALLELHALGMRIPRYSHAIGSCDGFSRWNRISHEALWKASTSASEGSDTDPTMRNAVWRWWRCSRLKMCGTLGQGVGPAGRRRPSAAPRTNRDEALTRSEFRHPHGDLIVFRSSRSTSAPAARERGPAKHLEGPRGAARKARDQLDAELAGASGARIKEGGVFGWKSGFRRGVPRAGGGPVPERPADVERPACHCYRRRRPTFKKTNRRSRSFD